MMNATRLLVALIGFVGVSAIASEPNLIPSPPAPSTASTSPAATLAPSIPEFSALNAATERSRIYRAGAAYSKWLDQIAKDSRSAFLQQRVFDRVTWMRLLVSVGALALLAIFAGSLVWIVWRRAGEIQSKRY